MIQTLPNQKTTLVNRTVKKTSIFYNNNDHLERGAHFVIEAETLVAEAQRRVCFQLNPW